MTTAHSSPLSSPHPAKLTAVFVTNSYQTRPSDQLCISHPMSLFHAAIFQLQEVLSKEEESYSSRLCDILKNYILKVWTFTRVKVWWWFCVNIKNTTDTLKTEVLASCRGTTAASICAHVHPGTSFQGPPIQTQTPLVLQQITKETAATHSRFPGNLIHQDLAAWAAVCKKNIRSSLIGWSVEAITYKEWCDWMSSSQVL